MQYFSDRESGELPRMNRELSPEVWRRIAWLVQERIENASFGQRFPEKCQDYPHDASVCSGVNIAQFEAAIKAEIPALAEMERSWRDSENGAAYGFLPTDRKRLWEMSKIDQPPLIVIMDIIEFCWSSIGKPVQLSPHSFFQHYHLRFDQNVGQSEFREEINLIFRRNGVPFNLTDQGRIERLIPEPLGSALRQSVFRTGDAELDDLLETARRKMVLPNEGEYRDALEKLWDAWERLKTIEDSDKAKGAVIMLDKAVGASQPNLRDLLEEEAKALTGAGNKLRIRHSETNQERLETSQQVDYLFQRMFSLIYLILHATGRVA